MASNAISMSFKVNKDLKIQADELFKNLGMNTSVAINMFLTQCVREQKLPFTSSMNSPEPSAKLKRALQEIEDDKNGVVSLKGYTDLSDLINALKE